MLRPLSTRALLLASALVAVPMSLHAAPQYSPNYTPPPPPLNTLPPCPADKALAKKQIKKNLCDPTNNPGDTSSKANPTRPAGAVQQFPYPGETPQAQPGQAPAAKAFPYPGDPAQPAAPAPASGQPPANTPASKAFPYPGDPAPPASAQAPANTPASKAFPYPGDPAPPASASSSSSSSSSSDSATPDAPAADPAQASSSDPGSDEVHSRRRLRPQAKVYQTDDERVDEDLNISHYYLQAGNTMGSYLRAQDAVKTQPDYAPTHFALAEAARKLKKNDEAVAEYKLYLKLAPDGKEAKAAEKALEQLH